VPNVRDAGSLSLSGLARAITDLTERARSGQLTPADSVEGTITITNIGVFGVDGGTPILNPGEAAILATGRIVDRPWAVDGALAVRPVMQLSLAFDHRVVDGASGSAFLADVAAYLHRQPL
jgi:pyruvate dehydrogenase E2 component (dihydrolipoamide acetyltransferase)